MFSSSEESSRRVFWFPGRGANSYYNCLMAAGVMHGRALPQPFMRSFWCWTNEFGTVASFSFVWNTNGLPGVGGFGRPKILDRLSMVLFLVWNLTGPIEADDVFVSPLAVQFCVPMFPFSERNCHVVGPFTMIVFCRLGPRSEGGSTKGLSPLVRVGLELDSWRGVDNGGTESMGRLRRQLATPGG